MDTPQADDFGAGILEGLMDGSAVAEPSVPSHVVADVKAIVDNAGESATSRSDDLAAMLMDGPLEAPGSTDAGDVASPDPEVQHREAASPGTSGDLSDEILARAARLAVPASVVASWTSAEAERQLSNAERYMRFQPRATINNTPGNQAPAAPAPPNAEEIAKNLVTNEGYDEGLAKMLAEAKVTAWRLEQLEQQNAQLRAQNGMANAHAQWDAMIAKAVDAVPRLKEMAGGDAARMAELSQQTKLLADMYARNGGPEAIPAPEVLAKKAAAMLFADDLIEKGGARAAFKAGVTARPASAGGDRGRRTANIYDGTEAEHVMAKLRNM